MLVGLSLSIVRILMTFGESRVIGVQGGGWDGVLVGLDGCGVLGMGLCERAKSGRRLSRGYGSQQRLRG